MNTCHPLRAVTDPEHGIGARAISRGKVAVLHAGALGLCSAILLARQHEVVIQDDRSIPVHMINNGWAPADDPEIQHQLDKPARTLRATQDRRAALAGAALVVIATPTSFTRWGRSVDTSDLDRALRDVAQTNPQALVVIESTLPVGYTRAMAQQLRLPRLLAAPTWVRPERAFFDRQHRAALIVGGHSRADAAYAEHWLNAAMGTQAPCLLTGSAEAEAIHLLHRKRELRGCDPTSSELAACAERHGLDMQQLFEGLALMAPPALWPADTSRPRPLEVGEDCRPCGHWQAAVSNHGERHATGTALATA
jgi:UDPglucose 6-dehydrogenase